MKISQEVRELIESVTPAHLVTLNRDGSPQMTLIWVGLDGDVIVAADPPETRRVTDTLRHPRVAVSCRSR